VPELTPEEVDHVALLARLELTADERERMRAELNAILEHFARLNELNTEDVPPTSHPLPIQNVFREDEARASLPRDSFLREAPHAEDEFFVVPRIVET
jgi:aspartyl-tRNA(Asn)/glutamyl-tRNA(Gln) amidotransferase subunit C